MQTEVIVNCCRTAALIVQFRDLRAPLLDRRRSLRCLLVGPLALADHSLEHRALGQFMRRTIQEPRFPQLPLVGPDRLPTHPQLLRYGTLALAQPMQPDHFLDAMHVSPPGAHCPSS